MPDFRDTLKRMMHGCIMRWVTTELDYDGHKEGGSHETSWTRRSRYSHFASHEFGDCVGSREAPSAGQPMPHGGMMMGPGGGMAMMGGAGGIGMMGLRGTPSLTP
jgi:hypothetical protein